MVADRVAKLKIMTQCGVVVYNVCARSPLANRVDSIGVRVPLERRKKETADRFRRLGVV